MKAILKNPKRNLFSLVSALFSRCCGVAVPPSIENQKTEFTVNQNREVSLPCRANGIPRPKIAWTKDGKAIATDEFRIRVLKSGWLMISITRCVTLLTPGGQLNSHQVGDSTHTRRVTQLTPGGWLNAHQVGDSTHTRWVTQLTPGGWLNSHQVGDSTHTRRATQLTPGGRLNSHQVGDSMHTRWATQLTPGGRLNAHQVWVTHLTPGGWLNSHQVGDSIHTRWVTQLTVFSERRDESLRKFKIPAISGSNSLVIYWSTGCNSRSDYCCFLWQRCIEDNNLVP